VFAAADRTEAKAAATFEAQLVSHVRQRHAIRPSDQNCTTNRTVLNNTGCSGADVTKLSITQMAAKTA